MNFGLVSIPIKLFRAARAEKIHLHKLQRETGARVRQVFVPESPKIPDATLPEPRHEPPEERTSTPPPAPGLSRPEIVHGFEYEKDQYVQFEPEELEKLAPKSSPDMQIVEFVKFAEIDPVYLETSYYVAPDAGGDKPYSLLFNTLKKTGYAAIGEFVMHRRDQVVVLRPGEHGLIAHTVFYEDEVRRNDEYRTDTGLIATKEMDLAGKLVDALAASFDPAKFKDHYRERLQQAVSQKVEAGEVTQSESPTAKAPVVDIMAALKESLAKARKPVASETRPAAKKTRRAGGR